MSTSLYDSFNHPAFNIMNVDEETKQIVSSYMRYHQRRLLPNNTLLRIIPDLVHHITILYYYRTHSHYEWKVTESDQLEAIKRAVPGQSFNNHFRLHNLDWFLKFYPNGTKQSKQGNVFLLLYLRSTPEISRMSATCRVWLKELEKGREHYKDFNDKNKYTGWRSGLVKTSEILDLERLTFEVTITIFEIYDKEENNVTNKYIGLGIDNKQTIQHLRKELEFEKHKVQQLTIEVDELSVQLYSKYAEDEDDEKYDNQDNKDNKEKDNDLCRVRFETWLRRMVKLPQYLGLFRECDCNDVRMIEFFAEDVLEREIGIKQTFHRKLIMKKAREFKAAQDAFTTVCSTDLWLKGNRNKLEMNGILRMSDFRECVQSKDDLMGICGRNEVNGKSIDSIWLKLSEFSHLNDID